MAKLRGIAHRTFTVLVITLLLSSVVAPAAFAGTATAQTAEGEDCSWDDPLLQLVGDSCTWDGGWETVNDSADRDAAYVQSDHHAELRGEMETSEQIRVVFNNYAQDTGTIASLEARNAIATAYENNESASVADTNAQTAITEYYSKKQVNTIEAFSKQQAQLAYTVNSTKNHPDTLNDFVYMDIEGSTGTLESYSINGLTTRNFTLANGTAYEYQTIEFSWTASNPSYSDPRSFTRAYKVDDFANQSVKEYGDDPDFKVNVGQFMYVRASYAGTSLNIENGHPAQAIADYQGWGNTVTMWGDQSSTIESNYAAGTASDLYTAIDDGRLDPADVRGAEGQVRYLSGDSNATDQRYKAALYGTLDMDQAGFNSTFYVDYTGYTEVNYNRTMDGTRTVNYTGYVENQSYEGMVFSGEVPDGGFQPGNTYNTSNLNGTTMIYSQNSGTVTFVKGNLTIQKITDENGTEQDSVSWEKPQYDTNNVSDYIDYLEQTQEMQLQLLEAYADDTDSTGTTSTSGWSPTQQQLYAIVAAVVIVGLVTYRGGEN